MSTSPTTVHSADRTSGTRHVLSPRSVAAWTPFGLSAALVVLGGMIPATSSGWVVDAVWALGFTAIGGALVQRNRHPALAAACLLGALGAVAFSAERYTSAAVDRGWPAASWTAWLAQWTWVPAVFLPMTVVLLLVPDGRALDRLKRLVPTAAALVALTTAALALLPLTNAPAELQNPVSLLPDRPAVVLGPLFLLLAVTAVVALLGLVTRLRQSQGVQRLQVTWITAGGLILVVGTFLNPVMPGSLGPLVEGLSAAALPAAIGVAMLRHQLWDTDPLLRRLLLYGLTVLLLGAGFGVVAMAAGVFVGGPDAWQAAAVAAFFTLLVGPVRRSLGGLVDRWMYGSRGDPAQALRDLSDQLSASAEPEVVLRATADAVRRCLGSPWVRLVGTDERGDLVAVESPADGREAQGGMVHVVPLVQAAEPIGRIEIAPRRGEHSLDPRDDRVLGQLTAVALAAVAAAVQQVHLRQARHELVEARELERLVLRRDLHDELGPVLASLGFTVDAARNQVRYAPEEAEELLTAVRRQVREAVQNVRRISRGLRPASLDELGLRGSLVAAGEQLRHAGLSVDVSVTGTLEELPPAVEVAVHAITTEALTNTARHARATHCRVELMVTPARCQLVICDDGVGIPPAPSPGVGLSSMRQRAEELGGTWTCIVDGGTRIEVMIPLEEE